MENLKKLYAKDIEREIQGVIKVDDESYIGQELEEYVVTEEMEKHFKLFFNNYKNGIENRSHNIGVWISGFFGSGKSHFLKIISKAEFLNLCHENPPPLFSSTIYLNYF